MNPKQGGHPGDTGDHHPERARHERPKKTFCKARTCDESEIASPEMTVRPQIAGESGPGRNDSSQPGQGRASKEGSRSIMTVDDVCAELGVARSTLYDWLAKGRAPRSIKLPNNQRRFRRADFEAWLDERTDEVDG